MKKILLISICTLVLHCFSNGQDFGAVDFDSEVTAVQPMTGIVFWSGNSNIETDAISLEYSYMNYSDIVTAEDEYDWTVVDNVLDEMSGRNHQAILRFRFTYPGRTTTVPQYIKEMADYVETEGLSEGHATWFPDWTHEELKDMTLKFYTAYADRYDEDRRLAFVQVGFGLWAEYHIYDGPFTLGKTFPSKEFQKTFFNHLDQVFDKTFWNISIDAADGTYSPFEEDPEYLDIDFGLFDDSFMHEEHSGYNTSSWMFFDRDRFKLSPAGGEFSYYTDYDQANVLNQDVGAHGIPYEIFAQNFHITYMIGNDQPDHHSMARIKEASMRSGYVFKLLSVITNPDSTIIEVVNLGVAPIYIDAHFAVNGVRSLETLKLLAPGEVRIFRISAGGTAPAITIESDDILATEEIQFFGTVNDYAPYGSTTTSSGLGKNVEPHFKIYPTLSHDRDIHIEYLGSRELSLSLYDSIGHLMLQEKEFHQSLLNLDDLANGVYYLQLREKESKSSFLQKIVLH